MKYIDADLLRKEIERQKGICTAQIKANPGQTFPFVMEMTGYDKLLSFLDTLSEEPCKGLDEAAEDAICMAFGGDPAYYGNKAEFSVTELERLFIAGAKWGAEHLRDSTKMMDKSLEEAADIHEAYYDVGEEHGYLYCLKGDIKNAFIAGARWQTEHLKK